MKPADRLSIVSRSGRLTVDDSQSLRSSFTGVAMTSLMRPHTWCDVSNSLIKILCLLFYVDVCTRQHGCLFSVDSPSLSLGDQSRVSGGCLERKESNVLFRVTSLFEMICFTSLDSFRPDSPFGMIWSRRIRL